MKLEEYYSKPIEIGDTVITSAFRNVDPTTLKISDPTIYIGIVNNRLKRAGKAEQDVVISILNKDSTSQKGSYVVYRKLNEVAKAPPEAAI